MKVKLMGLIVCLLMLATAMPVDAGTRCNDTACVTTSASLGVVNYNIYCAGKFPCWSGHIAAEGDNAGTIPVLGYPTLGGKTEVGGYLGGIPMRGTGTTSASADIYGVHVARGTQDCLTATGTYTPSVGKAITSYASADC